MSGAHVSRLLLRVPVASAPPCLHAHSRPFVKGAHELANEGGYKYAALAIRATLCPGVEEIGP